MRTARVLALVGVLLLLVAAVGFAGLQRASADPVLAAADASAKLCRYGVNATSRDPFTGYDMEALRIGWYLNYEATPASTEPAGYTFIPVIRLTQVGLNGYTYSPSGSSLTSAIATSPGASWMIGNEPDRRGTIQDNVEPHVYAAAYHELYHLIKDADPTAKIFAGTIVQPTPLRLRYLDMVLNSYQQTFGQAMPVDGWSIHNFILNEVSCNHDPANCWGADVPPGINEPYGEIVAIDDNDDIDRFKERIVRFRQWMKDRGYADRPLYLTEYGILMPPDFGFDAARVSTFMNSTFDYMASAADPNIGYAADGFRLVQVWSWYSTADTSYNGWLFDPNSQQLTAVGQNFAAHSAAVLPDNDLFPWRLSSDPGSPIYQGAPLTLQLRASIANSGNLAAPAGPVLVRFYRGDPTQGGTQIGGDQTVNLAGCGDHATVSVTWNGVQAGTHRIFVVADAANGVSESDEGNNKQEFTVLVGTQQTFIPRIGR